MAKYLNALAGKVALSLALVFLVVSASVGRDDEKETGWAIFGLMVILYGNIWLLRNMLRKRAFVAPTIWDNGSNVAEEFGYFTKALLWFSCFAVPLVALRAEYIDSHQSGWILASNIFVVCGFIGTNKS